MNLILAVAGMGCIGLALLPDNGRDTALIVAGYLQICTAVVATYLHDILLELRK